MEVHFTPELEAKLPIPPPSRVERQPIWFRRWSSVKIDEDARFIAAVERGEAALRHGDYLSHEQVGECLDRFLRS